VVKRKTSKTIPQAFPQAALSAMDAKLAQTAREKIKRQETPTKREQDALRRVERWQEEQLRQRYYRTVPKIHYRSLAGLTPNGLTKLVGNGFPAPGKTIDLFAVIRWLHEQLDQLSDQKTQAAEPKPTSPALERWREEKARLARFDRKEREGDLLDRKSVQEALLSMSAILRNLGTTIQRHHGPEAHELVMEAIDDWEKDCRASFGPEENNGRSKS
jgi:hypothetical protein